MRLMPEILCSGSSYEFYSPNQPTFRLNPNVHLMDSQKWSDVIVTLSLQRYKTAQLYKLMLRGHPTAFLACISTHTCIMYNSRPPWFKQCFNQVKFDTLRSCSCFYRQKLENYVASIFQWLVGNYLSDVSPEFTPGPSGLVEMKSLTALSLSRFSGTWPQSVLPSQDGEVLTFGFRL